jgi:hypothetical protein
MRTHKKRLNRKHMSSGNSKNEGDRIEEGRKERWGHAYVCEKRQIKAFHSSP